MLLITSMTLRIILGITTVTSRRNVVLPRSSLNLESVGTKAKSSHAAHDVLGQTRGWVGYKGNVLRLIRGTPSPMCKVSEPEIDHKLAPIHGVG
eukprot:scaffold160522_cov20-Tisochrysis_lutea.AAC.1